MKVKGLKKMMTKVADGKYMQIEVGVEYDIDSDLANNLIEFGNVKAIESEKIIEPIKTVKKEEKVIENIKTELEAPSLTGDIHDITIAPKKEGRNSRMLSSN